MAVIEHLRQANKALSAALREVEAGHILTRSEVLQLEEIQSRTRELRDTIIRYSALPGGTLAKMFGISQARISQIRHS